MLTALSLWLAKTTVYASKKKFETYEKSDKKECFYILYVHI